MIYYEDLLGVPYRRRGRGMDGMDCYGLAIECCRRAGMELGDMIEATGGAVAVNVARINSAVDNCIMQCVYEDGLHIGFMLDRQTVLHMTRSGARVAPLLHIENPVFFEVI